MGVTGKNHSHTSVESYWILADVTCTALRPWYAALGWS